MTESSVLPLSEFTVVRATFEQNVAHLKAQFVPWHRGRTFEEFCQNEDDKAGEGWEEAEQSQSWVLVRKDDLEGEIYSGCSTFRRKAFVKRKGSSEVEEAYLYAIRSVVTPVNHHKKGYARHMMKLLHYILASPSDLPPFPNSWGSPPPALSPELRQATPYGLGAFLYSDVGSFYEKATIGETRPGYLIDGKQNAELLWKVLPPGHAACEGSNEWEYLFEDDVQDLLPTLSKVARNTVNSANSDDHSVISMNPLNSGTVFYVPVRAIWEKVGSQNKEARKKTPFGVRLKSNENEQDTVILFAAQNKTFASRLVITLIHNLRPNDLPSLLAKLDEFADAKEGAKGWVWGLQPSDEMTKAWQGLKEREVTLGQRGSTMEHVLAVAWYGAEDDKPDFRSKDIWNWC